jgi:putative inorganic carbon (hco3(-)) transporter
MAPVPVLSSGRFLLPKEIVLHASAIALACLALWTLRSRNLDVVNAFVALAWSWCAISLIARTPLLDDGVRVFGLLTSALIVYLSARAFTEDLGVSSTHQIGIRGAIVATSLILSTMVVGEAYGFWQFSEWSFAPGATLGNRNRAAHLLVLFLPFVWAAVITASSRSFFLLGLATSFVSAWALTFSRTRAAWFVSFLIVGYAFVEVVSREKAPNRRFRSSLFLLAIVSGVGVAVTMANSLEWAEESAGKAYTSTLIRLVDFRQGSGQGRIIQYRTTSRLIIGNPLLGVGPGHWGSAYFSAAKPNDPSINDVLPRPIDRAPQSDVLGITAEFGLPVLIFGVGSLTGMWRRSRISRDATNPEATVFSMVLVAVVMLGAFNAFLLTPSGAFATAVSLGILNPCRRAVQTGSSVVSQESMPSRAQRLKGIRARQLFLTVLTISSTATLAKTVQVSIATHFVGNWSRIPHSPDRLDRAISLAPRDYEARVARIIYYVSKGNCASAQEDFRVALQIFPSAPLLVRLGKTCATVSELSPQPRINAR